MQTCTCCELPFIPSSKTQNICIPCEKINNDEELTDCEEAHMLLAQEFKDLLDTTKDADATVNLQKKLDRALKKIDTLQKKLKAKPREKKPTAQLESAFIMKLISLCHPDKHNNSTDATEATQKLLELRKGSTSK
jgi:hypothetical protein